MACNSLVWGLLLFGFIIRVLTATSEDEPSEYMSKEEREALKDEARDMFYHAYNAYMDNAYPADELMPLTCKGRYRGSEPNRGDIDSTLGNFSLTLVDTLDTLVVLSDLEEFENAVKLVTRDVNFDTDVIVSLFETNIRMLGGLLSGHILAEYLQQRADIMPWYKGELLDLAKDLGYRFLPAFNTTTGIPYGRINLKYGMKGVPLEVSRETCTACAGSMILEMAALSRLTGESIFEEKAQKAMDVLWRLRHRGTDLMGSVLNVNSGDWVRRDSGVGAGIDSYYEYCLKAYILLGDEKYLGRFNKHYQAVMKYVSQGPMLLDVHMHRPNTNSKNFMDALLAFWPGLQVLKGDIKPAVETHEMLYQVMQRHNFIPEAFTTDFQVHWGHHPLRPEFLESTYFLYRATGDHYYLGVGRKVLKSLQTYARVPCGYAAVSDVRTNKHDDTMDSFVLSETFKYLFLLFAEPNELVLDLDEFIFTTEGHLLPLTLASVRTNISSHDFERDIVHVDEFDRTCPNSLHLFPASVRQPLRNMVEDVCPRRSIKRRLSASQFQANNIEHLKMLSDMGITMLTLADGRVQLLHTFSNAKTPQDSEEGLLFMQEMVELSKMESQQAETKPQIVSFIKSKSQPPQKVTLLAGPAQFGPEFQGLYRVVGKVVIAYPALGCSDFLNADDLVGKIVVVIRGNCMFIEKARRIQSAGAIAGIVVDNVDGSSAAMSPMFAMSGDGRDVDDVNIPVVFLFSKEADELFDAMAPANADLIVTIGDTVPKEEVQLKAPTDLSMFERLKGSLKSFLTRQITPQTSTVGGPNIVDITVLDTDQQENQVETINFLNLHADIIEDFLGGELRISVTLNSPISVNREFLKVSREQTPVEIQWRQLKQVFVNEIYNNAKQKKRLHIRTVMLTNYYDWVSKARNRHRIIAYNNKLLSQKVMWFLIELSEFEPNPSITKMGHLLESNKQLLLKQRVLAQMDAMVLDIKPAVEKLKIIAIRSEMEHLLKITELYRVEVDTFSFLCELLRHMLVADDDAIKQHMKLLNQVHIVVHNSYQDILLNAMQRNLEKPQGGKSSYYPGLIDIWQTNLNILRKVQVILGKKIDDDSSIAEIITNESKKEVESKEPSKATKKSRGVGAEKFDDFEYFILTEIEKAMENTQQNTLLKIEEIQEASGSLAASGKSKSTSASGKIVMHSISHNQSKDENSRVKGESDGEKENNSAHEAEAEHQHKTSGGEYKAENKEDEEAFARKLYKKIMWDTRFQLLDETTKVDINSEDIVSNDERWKLLQEIQKEIVDAQAIGKNGPPSPAEQPARKQANSGKIASAEPVEEFKKPVWASDEKKIKRFTEFRAKSEMSDMKYDSADAGKADYQEEYVKLKQDESSKDGHESKHIDDEL